MDSHFPSLIKDSSDWDGKTERRISERRSDFCSCHFKFNDILKKHDAQIDAISKNTVSNKLFYWVIGVFILCFGWVFGVHLITLVEFNKTQIAIYEKINAVAKDVAVLKAEINKEEK